MKKTYLKTVYREIKESFARFAAIFAIVALGVGFLSGLLITTPDMHQSVNQYYDEYDMADIYIKGTLGLTKQDLEKVSAVEEIEEIMPAYVTDQFVQTDKDQTLTARIYGVPLENLEKDKGFINRLELIEGRLPQNKNECLVERKGNFFADIEVGTVITLVTENSNSEAIEDTFNTTEYTVVGVVGNPFYFSLERELTSIGHGQLETVVYVDESCYSLDVYTDFYIKLKDTQGLSAFDDEYEAYVEEVVAKLEEIGKNQSALRSAEVIGEAKKELEEGKLKYAEAKEEAEAKLAQGYKKIEEGKKAITAAEADLAKGKEELQKNEKALAEERQKAQDQITAMEKSLLEGEAELEKGKAALAQTRAQLDEVKEDIEQAKQLLASGVTLSDDVLAQIEQYDAGLAAYEAGMAEISVKEKELAAGKASLEAGKKNMEKQFLQAEKELEQARLDLAKGEAELEKKKQELLEGEAKYNEEKVKAEAELREAADELAQAEDKVKEIEEGKWYILDRNSNVSFASFDFNSEKVAAIAKVFPVFFILVAGLVALTTMTRMVEEERIQIGTLKALGYGKGTIMSKYIIYCGLATLLGCLVGLVTGFQILPMVIWNAYATLYHLPKFIPQFSLSFSIITTLTAVGCTMAATISACYQALREKPSRLMLPKAPKPGKRIFLEYIPFIWNPLKFSYKATARNLLRYKKHFFMTVLGIAGCTALIVAGVGLRDSISKIAITQFDELIQYDLTVTVKESSRENPTLEKFLNDRAKVEGAVQTHSDTGMARGPKDELSATIYVPKDHDELEQVVTLRNRETSEKVEFNSASVVLAEKLAESLGVGIGDSFVFENSEGETGEFVVTGITENYVGTYIYINADDYVKAFKEEPFYNTFLIKTFITDQEEKNEVLAALLDSGTVVNAQFISQTRETYEKLLTSVNYIVLVVILAAGALAVIVLYNLTNININERKRELATLRVLGFHHHEVGSYIFREIAILSIIGTLVGLVFGVFLFDFVVKTAESPEFMFGRDLSVSTFVLSAVVTLFFSAVVDLIMYQKLKKIEMVESLKAVD